ncbi:16617_t:CDS:1 [Dentiscutata heterogama]|uniref:16617_t:CDS:1 n=1 Tax=Dentiscutata heterogama TaxID=1316150 RepID=A0ACA9K562_9GLOM|nr:16617_t:CDS:1 [Dentiscutata heterogama]
MILRVLFVGHAGQNIQLNQRDFNVAWAFIVSWNVKFIWSNVLWFARNSHDFYYFILMYVILSEGKEFLAHFHMKNTKQEAILENGYKLKCIFMFRELWIES